MASFEWPAKGSGGGGGGLITSISNTNSIDLTETSGDLTADLNLSAEAAGAGNILSDTSIKSDGLLVELPILVGDTGSGGTAGVVPAPAAGDAAADKFLKADGTWVAPSGAVDSVNGQTGVVSLGLDDLTDVILGTPVANDVLIYDGTDWISQAASSTGLITSVTNTNSIDLTETAGDLTADLNLSAAAADAGNINASNSIETDGLQVQVAILVGDTGAGGAAGVVPAPGMGDATKFLKGDATWHDVVDALPGTTKGDIYVFDGSNTIRLGVGTDDQILTADSVEASGVKWAAAPAAGATLHNATFTGTTVTVTADQFQKFRYTGGSAQTLVTLDFASMPDGARLVISGSSDTDTLTIPTSITNVRMNGERVLYQYSAIEFIKDDTQLIEV